MELLAVGFSTKAYPDQALTMTRDMRTCVSFSILQIADILAKAYKSYWL